MTYAKGRTYIPRKEREIKVLLKNKDIEGLLWLILEDSFGFGEESTVPKELRTFAIQQLTLMQKGKKEVLLNSSGEDSLIKWLNLEGGGPSEPEEER